MLNKCPAIVMLPPIPAASATGVVEESDALAQLPQPQPQLALAAARPSPFVQTPLMLSAPLSAIAGWSVAATFLPPDSPPPYTGRTGGEPR
ncbi:MAG: hypothetical protein M1832_003229 [Thelocarpon impressellum]|nr:MAG: hypothetical protein M1832_003229 [Thelocarpon impressellum]